MKKNVENGKTISYNLNGDEVRRLIKIIIPKKIKSQVDYVMKLNDSNGPYFHLTQLKREKLIRILK